MHKTILCLAATLLLSSCALFQLQKQTVEQGNIISADMTQQLHLGMSEQQVRNIMGSPLLVNIFTPNRIDYVYTYSRDKNHMFEKRVTCVFVNGSLHSLQIR